MRGAAVLVIVAGLHGANLERYLRAAVAEQARGRGEGGSKAGAPVETKFPDPFVHRKCNMRAERLHVAEKEVECKQQRLFATLAARTGRCTSLRA